MNEIRFDGRCEKHCSPLPCIACENTALQTALQERDAELEQDHEACQIAASFEKTVAGQRKVLEQALEALVIAASPWPTIGSRYRMVTAAITAIQEQLKS